MVSVLRCGRLGFFRVGGREREHALVCTSGTEKKLVRERRDNFKLNKNNQFVRLFAVFLNSMATSFEDSDSF